LSLIKFITMGSFDFVTADKFGKKWLDLFGPLALEFGSFLAVSGLDLAPWQKVDLGTLVIHVGVWLKACRFASRNQGPSTKLKQRKTNMKKDQYIPKNASCCCKHTNCYTVGCDFGCDFSAFNKNELLLGIFIGNSDMKSIIFVKSGF